MIAVGELRARDAYRTLYLDGPLAWKYKIQIEMYKKKTAKNETELNRLYSPLEAGLRSLWLPPKNNFAGGVLGIIMVGRTGPPQSLKY